MNLQIHPLGREEIPIFNREDNRAFSVHDQYFADGHVPGATEEEREEYNLEKIIGIW